MNENKLTLKERIKRLGLMQKYIADQISDDSLRVDKSEICSIVNNSEKKNCRNMKIRNRLTKYLSDREKERGI